MWGVTLRDRVRNEHIRGSVKVTEVSKKVQEARLRWFGHIMRREDEEQHVAREAMIMEVEGIRRRGRPRVRWRDCISSDMRAKNLNRRSTQNRNIWKKLIKNSDPE